ncbi:uncharacterized protein [Globicephala melas]|uniref:uncharacterized protein n=1 Tax=Globicephala melas TaxID=9731 RepID=UPI00293D5759|nr:basic proline-rich protein-like [Globicephala melas]
MEQPPPPPPQPPLPGTPRQQPQRAGARGGWARDPPPGRTAASLARPPETGSLRASAVRAEVPPPPHARRASDSPRGRIPGWEGPARQPGAERESMPAARPSGAGQREPPERQRRWRRRRRQQHPPLSVPALGVAAAGRHECYYIERRCRSIALSQWQGATGLILRAVRGVHLSPAASLRPPPPPPGPTAAPVWARVGARGERDAPQRSAAAAEGQGLEGHRGRAAERPETEKWETPVRPPVLFMKLLIYTFTCLTCETTSVFRVTGSTYLSSTILQNNPGT